MATYTWNGQLGTEWDATAGTLTNWDGPGMEPIPGNDDIAIINTATTITDNYAPDAFVATPLTNETLVTL